MTNEEYDQFIEHLTWIANAKPGHPLPEWLGGATNNWGPPLSKMAKDALEVIRNLEAIADQYGK